MSSLGDLRPVSVVTAALLLLLALLHISLAFGLRRGDLVWSGRHPRLLPPELRRWSLGYGVLLLFAAWVLAGYAGVVGLAPIPGEWHRSVGWIVTVSLGMIGVYTIWRGRSWERYLFGSVAVLGAVIAGLETFGV